MLRKVHFRSPSRLIHEPGGVLFGPAMNEAYSLESKSAIYPRILVFDTATQHLQQMFKDDELISPMFQSFDGFNAVDMVSLLNRTQTKPDEVEQFKPKLDAIEVDILINEKSALPKVRYLQDRWLQLQGARAIHPFRCQARKPPQWPAQWLPRRPAHQA